MSPHEQELDSFLRLCSQIVEFGTENDLVRKTELGDDASFERARPLFDGIVELFRDLGSVDLNGTPLPTLQRATQSAQTVLSTLKSIQRFSSKNRLSPSSDQQKLITALETQYEKIISGLGSRLGYLLVKRSDIGNMEALGDRRIQELDEYVSAEKQQLTTIREEAESTLSVVRAGAGHIGVSKESGAFKEQAEKNATAATWWLLSSITLFVGSPVVVWKTLFASPLSSETVGELVRGIGGRFAILTLLAFVLSFCVRQYTASKHNETVNRHRQNSLQTFETFVSAAADQETKDAVLLEATRSIFSAQPSGFLRGRHEAESPSTIIEVIRRMSSASSNRS